MMLNTIILTAALALAQSPVEAQPSASDDQIVITVTAQDTATQAGLAKIRHRVAMAIEEVCGSYASIESWQVPDLDDCREAAWREADQQLAAIGQWEGQSLAQISFKNSGR